jgi:cell division protein FtsB
VTNFKKGAKNVKESSAKEAVVAELQADIISMEDMITQMKKDNFTLKAKMNQLERDNTKLTKETFDLREGMGNMLTSRR